MRSTKEPPMQPLKSNVAIDVQVDIEDYYQDELQKKINIFSKMS